MNDFYRHKRSDKIKWVFTGIAFVLVFVMLAGVIMQIFGKGKVKPSEWFKKSETENSATIPDENGGAVINESASNGVRLMSKKIARAAYAENGISPQAENAYTLTATVTPSAADNKAVEWSVEWKNPSSPWATGKTVTDYVTVTPASDGALTATVACNAAFGEPINITVAARSNRAAKAVCQVDYVRKLVSGGLTSTCALSSASSLILNNPSATTQWAWLPLADEYESPYDWIRYTSSFSANLSETYTIDNTVTSQNLTLAASSQLISALNSNSSISDYERQYYQKSYTYSASEFHGQRSVVGSYEDCKEGLFHFMVQCYSADGDYDYYPSGYYEKLKSALKSCDVDLVFTVNTTLSDGSTVSTTYNVNVADSSLSTPVVAVSLSDTTLRF